MTDAELLWQAQSGDRDAWKLLYSKCLPVVWRQAVAQVGDCAVAEEIVSETFLALVRSLPKLDADEVSLYSWLRGVVRHKVADHARRAARQGRLLSAARDSQPHVTDDSTVSGPVETEEKKQKILTILDRLPELQRLVLEWKHVDDWSIRQIAEHTGKTEKAVESILYRARKEFRRLYELSFPDDSFNHSGLGPGTNTLKTSL